MGGGIEWNGVACSVCRGIDGVNEGWGVSVDLDLDEDGWISGLEGNSPLVPHPVVDVGDVLHLVYMSGNRARYTHTHTHTHIYIYECIYMYKIERERHRDTETQRHTATDRYTQTHAHAHAHAMEKTVQMRTS